MGTTSRIFKADLVVIGAGSGGLSVAAAAAQLGLKVVLFEQGEMGGDCLNYGRVPSKALIAAAEAAHRVRQSASLGVTTSGVEVDFAASWRTSAEPSRPSLRTTASHVSKVWRWKSSARARVFRTVGRS